ncbi:MAG: Uma2 family endonuclease [Deltaproteobacteria bacterium]|nr:Uma2 family endonuclease [Deltaproteobacteria bacterium]
MAVAARKLLSYADYLQVEEETQVKHEWRAGVIVAMAGGTVAHSELGGRVFGLLFGRLDGKPCRPYNSDLKLRIPAEDVATYADVAVVCGEPIRDQLDDNALVNPTVVIEVLSESTEDYDRNEKFDYYQALGTLREYVLVSQHEVRVEHYVLRGPGTWEYRRLGPGDTLALKSVRAKLPVDEVYRGVTLEPRKKRRVRRLDPLPPEAAE